MTNRGAKWTANLAIWTDFGWWPPVIFIPAPWRWSCEHYNNFRFPSRCHCSLDSMVIMLRALIGAGRKLELYGQPLNKTWVRAGLCKQSLSTVVHKVRERPATKSAVVTRLWIKYAISIAAIYCYTTGFHSWFTYSLYTYPHPHPHTHHPHTHQTKA